MGELVKRKINDIIVSHKVWVVMLEILKKILQSLTLEYVALISVKQ